MAHHGYTTTLFECFSDMSTLAFVALCGLCGLPQAYNWAGSREEKCGAGYWFCLVHPVWTRRNIRQRNSYRQPQYLTDYCTYCVCGPCAVRQDARELKALGRQVAALEPSTSDPVVVTP
jgi:Cys-rich protein (TIGR01571 family)